MFSRLATVLQELSGEEGPDGDPQGMLVPQLPTDEDQASGESEVQEEATERLAHLEQLVVQLKELIRDKDTQLIQKDTELSGKDAQHKSEKEEAEARFTKLKLQAKAKMASLNKQISDLKGQEGATQSPDSSFTGAGVAVEEELQELKKKLSNEEAKSRELQERLQTTEQLLQDKESIHAEQLQKLQSVVCEKDVRFQEQIQKHEEELLTATSQQNNDGEVQQALFAAQRRCEELEEALNSRSQVLEMLQQEVSSADQQKQILTVQFRQMEHELSEAVRQREEERQQWVEQARKADAEVTTLRSSLESFERANMEAARLETELASLKEAELVSQEALGNERMEVARLERELALIKETELEAAQAHNNASERDKAEILRLENELATMREVGEHAGQERLEVDKLEKGLASIKEEQEEAQRKGAIVAEIWPHLRRLAVEDVEATEETVPADLSMFMDAMQSIETQLKRMKDERSQSENHCAELTHTMETLQETLNRKEEETTDKIQELEHQIVMMSERVETTETSVQESSEAQTERILELEQQLLEKDYELKAMKVSLSGAQEQTSNEVSSCEQTQDQVHDDSAIHHDSSAAPPDFMEDTQEEETTLIAGDTSVFSVSADNESSPELIEHQSDSPEESKVTSSDEMVASSDSEVAHSSWTLLEAVNQEGGQEWPSMLQDFSQMQLQSWEATSMESETSTVQVESSSLIIRETVQVQLSQQGSFITDGSGSSSQVFAQALADELQKRYSELLAELQRLKDAAAESQEKIRSLEEETSFLRAAKEEAESHTNSFTEELKSAREELEKFSQESSTGMEKQSVELKLLEEQIEILSNDRITKEEKIQHLQADLEAARQTFSEQEGQVRMLCAQLEDRELLSSELEKRLQDMENSVLESSQNSELTNVTLTMKDSEISELHIRLSQKEQEMMELNESMSAKLLQAEEEKFQIDTEVNKLKEQIIELEKVRHEKPEMGQEDLEEDEVASLRKERGVMESQLTMLKKKLQAALVQRKELLKKVADFEAEKEKEAQQDIPKGETPSNIQEAGQSRGEEIQEMESQLIKLEEALRFKEEAFKALEQTICEKDQILSETLDLNSKLRQELENSQQESDVSSETAVLQSRVASLEAECEGLQRKVQEAQESRKETIRKAKEKDRHHREQLKQQKEEYTELMDRFEVQSSEQDVLQTKLRELEEKSSSERQTQSHKEKAAENVGKPSAGEWVQEDWVDFATSEREEPQPQSNDSLQQPAEQSEIVNEQVEESLKALQAEIQTVRIANTELEKQLQETEGNLSIKEAELSELGKELQALKEKERQIDALSEEINDLREKYHQAESFAESLKADIEAEAKISSENAASSIANLQAEAKGFKQFLDDKNQEILELGQQLNDQNSLIHSMQDTVTLKDQFISSLQEELKAEQEKTQRLEVEIPLRQEEEKGSEEKFQQLQRKLQAALISRKDALKENKTLKTQLASTEKLQAELQKEMESAGDELTKLRAEKAKLIDEVDRMLLENQNLGSSCESLKLVMEGVLGEKNALKNEAELAKEEAGRICKEWEEKVHSMKDEYETLLKSYENVSDEAERVRRVLEAARQERQELAAKVRSHEAARQEAERQAEESQKEVETVKDKMRKFAKTKQQKILELEEENECLRENQERSGIKREGRALKVEVEGLQDELVALKAELDDTAAERDSFVRQIEDLKEQLAQAGEKEDNANQTPVISLAAVVEEVVHAQQSEVIMTKAEPVESQNEDQGKSVTQEETPEEQASTVEDQDTQSQPPVEKEKEETTASDQAGSTETVKSSLEEKIKEMDAALNAERDLWYEQETKLKADLASLEQDLQESKDRESLVASLEKCLQEGKKREKSLIEEGTKREMQVKELLKCLETEKDNLEERLMNQLAQLNGSIAGYQQEAVENRDKLLDLQREAERLERERAELEAEVQSEKDKSARLEEDLRQAQRERAEAEAESGKQRELEQQLKSVQRVKEGSQSRARQLEELLREKQMEVRQLQKDAIQYQEKISDLCREAKALQLAHNELKNKLEQSQLEISKVASDLKKTEEELSSCKSQLDEAQDQKKEAIAEKTAIEKNIQQNEALLKAEAEETLDSVRFRLGAELKEMELRLEEAYADRDKEEEATMEAKEMAEGVERRAQEMQARLDESLARLAAFSRCMSSLQDDRDRVLDEAKQWETRFNDALQGKEAGVREAEMRAKDLSERLQRETALKEELQQSVDRLEKAGNDWQLKMEAEEKKVTEIQAALEEETSKLQETTAELQSAQAENKSLNNELKSLHQRTRALEEAVSQLQGEVNQARTELREREEEERRLCLNVEHLEADLRTSKALTESLQTELHEKEKREVELLEEKEKAVVEAAEEARKEADSRAKAAEDELEQRRGGLRDLEEKLRKAEEESNSRTAKLDSFTKAMGSLQDDRDRVLTTYKQLEEKHLQVMMEKDGLIQEAAAENNSLKEELRSLLVQRDDLYAEKAHLSSQLHNYRDELNQVLSMKDSQQKKLLAGQLERIASLEKDRNKLESQINSLTKVREAELGAEKVERENLSQAADVTAATLVIDAPGAEVEKLREQLQAARGQVETLEETLQKERQEQEGKSKELAELQWEGGVMRTESENAQERVAELARDLLVVEQKLLEEREVTTKLKAENHSFSKAMVSLQDSRDEAVNKAKELSLKLEEMSTAGGRAAHSSPGGSTGEVWGLKNALQALQNDRERLLEQLQAQTTELKKQKSELARLGAGELIKVSQELFEEKKKNEDMLSVLMQLENVVEIGKQEIETLRLERIDWMAQAEQLKQQTLATLSERDQQLRQLTAMLEEARINKPKLQQELYQREGSEEVDSAPGAPQERSSYLAELKELQRRLDEEMQQRVAAEEQLIATQDRLKHHSQAQWHHAQQEDHSETAVFIEPSEGAVSRSRRGGPGLMRMLRVAFCSRQRTPLLLGIYLLTVHVLLLMCLGGYL